MNFSEADKLLEDIADPRSKVPYLVLIYPLDQNYLKSGFLNQKWVLKCCCMFPGEEHVLGRKEDEIGNETNFALGVYQLNDLGKWTGPAIGWMKKNEKIFKTVSPRLGKFLEWVHQDQVTNLLSQIGDNAKNLSLPEDSAIKAGRSLLPTSSEIIALHGLTTTDYRELEGQELVFLQEFFEKHPRPGRLDLFIIDGKKLWLCNEHGAKVKAERGTGGAILVQRLSDLLSQYREVTSEKVSRVRLLGEKEYRTLNEIFVELNLFEECDRSSVEAEWKGIIDATIRKRRQLFEPGFFELLSQAEQAATKIKRTIKPERLLKPGTRAFIFGAPGSGKSTLLHYIAYRTLQDPDRLPLLIELKSLSQDDLARANGKLETLIGEYFISRHPSSGDLDDREREALRRYLHKKLREGRVVILLDGLDEVSRESYYDKLQQAVRVFLNTRELRDNTILISTRPHISIPSFSSDEAEKMEIAPLNLQQIEKFITRYFTAGFIRVRRHSHNV